MRCPVCHHFNVDGAHSCAACGRQISPGFEDAATSPVGEPHRLASLAANAPGPVVEVTCDCCGRAMPAGREMCEACERSFASVLGSKPVEADRMETPQVDARGPTAEPAVSADPPDRGEGQSAPEPWWKAQRRHQAVLPPVRRPPPPAPPNRPIAIPNPPTPVAASTAAPAAPVRPRRAVERIRSLRAPRRPHLVRPALAAAAALTIVVVLAMPAGRDAGRRLLGDPDTSTVSLLSALEPGVATVDTVPASVPAASEVRAATVPPSAAGPAAASAGARPGTSAKDAARPTVRRSRRSTGPAAPREPARSEAPAPPPVVEPLPASPTVETTVLTSAPPLVGASPSGMAPSGVVLELSQVDVRPEVQSRVAPRRPTHLAGQRIDDVVVLRVLVSPAGRASDVRVLRASKVDASLDAAAVEAVKQWRFTPAHKGGRPVSCWFSVGVPVGGE